METFVMVFGVVVFLIGFAFFLMAWRELDKRGKDLKSKPNEDKDQPKP